MRQIVDPLMVEFLVKACGMRASEIAPDKRLREDLGVDGDDAVNLFAAFEEWFGGDLGPLYEHWGQHFNGEGYSLGDAARFVTGGSVVMIAAVLFAAWAGWPDWGATSLGIGTAALWAGPLRCWPLKRPLPLTPITVGDLIQAADSGRWPLSYA